MWNIIKNILFKTLNLLHNCICFIVATVFKNIIFNKV